MESRFKALGHGVHPILIVFPLGLLAGSLIFDVVRLVTGNESFAAVSYWLLPAGIIGGLAAAVPGLVDWLGVPKGTRAYRVGLIHASVNVLALVVFFVSWRLRAPETGFIPTTPALIASVVGTLLASVGGWLGGELVERLGISVHDGANLNARSSLSGKV
jgi:uncharacterized membrane protein